jgi:hypothetical protein
MVSQCVIDPRLDLAKCKAIDDPTNISDVISKPAPVIIDDSIPPDGTRVAFTGFPLRALTPLTTRAHIAGYQVENIPGGVLTQELRIFGFILDKAAWPGVSGSPLYLIDGHAVGMVLQRGSGVETRKACPSEGSGLAYESF